MICPNCNANIDDNFKFCPSCGVDLHKPIICPECKYENEPNSKFCQECGKSLTNKNNQKSTDTVKPPISWKILEEIDPVPSCGMTIEFPYSSSSSFEFAVKEAEKFSSFVKFRDGKDAIYRITINEKDTEMIAELLEQLKGWRKRTVYVNGEKVPWDSVFGYLWCFNQKRSNFRPDLYCFGYDNAWEFNLWGCLRLNMPFSSRSPWGTYGKWLNNKGDWQFDKNQILFEIKKNIYNFRYCPAVNLKMIEEVLALIPNSVNPFKNHDWKFIESYDLENNNGLIMTKKDEFGFVSKHALIGVSLNSNRFIDEIRKKISTHIPNEICFKEIEGY